jgi:hypothetical protein
MKSYVVQRQRGAAPLEFVGTVLAGSLVQSRRGGTFSLTLFETAEQRYVVSLVKDHPTKKHHRGAFAWEHPELLTAVRSLRPGELTDDVMDQLRKTERLL